MAKGHRGVYIHMCNVLKHMHMHTNVEISNFKSLPHRTCYPHQVAYPCVDHEYQQFQRTLKGQGS